MGVVQGARDLLDHAHRFPQLHRTADPIGESAALDELEHEIQDAVLVAVVEHLEDVRVLEPRHRACLLLEALAVAGIVGEEVGQDLDGDVAVERGVVGAVHGRHPAPSEPVHDAVGAEGHPLVDVHLSQPKSATHEMAAGARAAAKEAARTMAAVTARQGVSSVSSRLSATTQSTTSSK